MTQTDLPGTRRRIFLDERQEATDISPLQRFLNAVGTAARAIMSGQMELALARGAESMTRAPFVIGKPDAAFGRGQSMEDTTMG
jgi:acetyl-CoA acyltransferase